MPNLWDASGKPCYEPESGWKIELEADYRARQQWDWEPRWKGYRGHFPTAEDDFSAAHQPSIEEELEELI